VPTIKAIVTQSVNDLVRCINLSSLLELSGWPKPGNVHRTKNFPNTRFEHFLAGIAAIQPNFKGFCETVYNSIESEKDNFSSIELGLFFKEAANQMMKWQSGGNVLLGHILILAPLAAAATICLKLNMKKIENFEFIIKKVIEDATVKDTVNLYDAIKTCNPGGLGNIEKYDINDENSYKDIINDNINLKKIFELSKEYDLISNEYASGFNIILKEGLPYFFDTYEKCKDINSTIVNTYLKLLSTHLDTLIIRKAGKETDSNLTILLRSKPVQNKANRELLNLIKKKLKVSSDQVQIIAGLKKTDKILQVSFSENIVESDIIKRIFN